MKPEHTRKKEILTVAGIAVCAAVAILCLVMLISYGVSYFRAKQQQAMLAQIYRGTETAAPTAVEATEQPQATAVPQQTAAPAAQQTAVQLTAAPKATYDPFGGYPNNRYRTVSDRFKELQKVNKDLCAWVTIDGVLDQAVVQRDNTYYLTRDYTGSSNVNGAVFLDEQVSLNVRPTAYIVYGHNMKTGAMFGQLHKYENKTFYKDHGIVTFDTMYEDGQFVVFASGKVDLTPGTSHFVDYYNLPKATGDRRMQIISKLKATSDFAIDIDVSADDQLLILVTCTGDDANRRLLAARRLRTGETPETFSMPFLLMQPQ